LVIIILVNGKKTKKYQINYQVIIDINQASFKAEVNLLESQGA
jgi:hypothetical protein